MTTEAADRDRSDALVLFGVSGDLARKKLFCALVELAETGALPGQVIGVAASGWSDADLRTHAREAVDEFGPPHVDRAALDRMTSALRYLQGDYKDPDTYERLCSALRPHARPLLYLAIPPSLFETVVQGLTNVGLHERGRIVVEKPFGRDLGSARELNRCILRSFPEESVFRIDHFLAKEQVLDLLVFRLANTLFAPAWSRQYIDSVQITMGEEFGVEGRGRFYDEVGVIRDVVANHLLQVVALVAMEPPVAADAQALRDEKAKVLRALRPIDPADVVRGQFRGYRDEDGVASDSRVETFVALKAYIDSWRWAGVPFYIRAGKRMPVTTTEVLIEFVQPPLRFFADADSAAPHPNHLRFRLKPGERVSVGIQVKEPGERIVSRGVDLSYEYEGKRDGVHGDAYARLLREALRGDQQLFARADGVEHAWRALDPVLGDRGRVLEYEAGTWGPAAADELTAEHGGWHPPEVDAGG